MRSVLVLVPCPLSEPTFTVCAVLSGAGAVGLGGGKAGGLGLLGVHRAFSVLGLPSLLPDLGNVSWECWRRELGLATPQHGLEVFSCWLFPLRPQEEQRVEGSPLAQTDLAMGLLCGDHPAAAAPFLPATRLLLSLEP